MSPEYPKQGNFYTFDSAESRYKATEPPTGTDLSSVPTMNRAERRRQEREARRLAKQGRNR